jgi:hypothetical protein
VVQNQEGEGVNHLVNANKKVVSKTPRTDRQPYITAGFNKFVKIGFARQLERQLAAANKRVKELEAKADELQNLKKWLEGR